MSDIEPITSNRSGQFARPGSANQPIKSITAPAQIAFNRRELDQILSMYGRRVAAGEWRDYAIDMLRDKAVFSIFRRSCETPLYRIEKNPKTARKQGPYSVIAATGLIVRRGHDLSKVLRVLDHKLKLVEL